MGEVLVRKGLRVSGRAEMGTARTRVKGEYGRSWVRWLARIASTGRTVFHDVLGIVLPRAGVRLVPGYFCLILGRVISKGGRIVYRFDRLDYGLIALFQKKINAFRSFLVKLFSRF